MKKLFVLSTGGGGASTKKSGAKKSGAKKANAKKSKKPAKKAKR